MDHLNLIYNAAPDRVGIFGLVAQEKHTKNSSSFLLYYYFLIFIYLIILLKIKFK